MTTIIIINTIVHEFVIFFDVTFFAIEYHKKFNKFEYLNVFVFNKIVSLMNISHNRVKTLIVIVKICNKRLTMNYFVKLTNDLNNKILLNAQNATKLNDYFNN